MFSGEREGPENQPGICLCPRDVVYHGGELKLTSLAFHVESPDQSYVIQGVTPPPEGFRQGAPSRPPSRTTNKSPLGSVAEWVATEAQGNVSGNAAPSRF